MFHEYTFPNVRFSSKCKLRIGVRIVKKWSTVVINKSQIFNLPTTVCKLNSCHRSASVFVHVYSKLKLFKRE